jgi:hypothetical protein
MHNFFLNFKELNFVLIYLVFIVVELLAIV